jgi:fibro-slime domain-containing protein
VVTLLVTISMAATVLVSTATPSASADPIDPDSITLTGTARDFLMGTPPDFETAPITDDRGIVTDELGADGKPVYAPVPPATTATTSGRDNFNTWYHDTPGTNQSIPVPITLAKEAGTTPTRYGYSNNAFFPIDDQGFGNQGYAHNYSFTYELHTQFTFQGGETFSYVGDDDVFVYINNRLAINLGGIHGAEGATVDLNSFAPVAGMSVGGTYHLDVFFAERHTSGSDFAIETTLKLAPQAPPAPPTAVAGPDQTVPEGSTVTLDGSQSKAGAPNGTLSYKWETTSIQGPPPTLSSTTAARPQFFAPDDGTYAFKLTFNDGFNSSSSVTHVKVTNQVPTGHRSSVRSTRTR